VAAYLDFVTIIVPEKHLENVLEKNAFNIFTRIPPNKKDTLSLN
jgi:hypothetical protein